MSTGSAHSSHDMSKSVTEMLDNATLPGIVRRVTDEHRSHEALVRTSEQVIVERRLRLKADVLILPICFVAYLMDFLDRSDLGNAAVAGMTKDLNMSAQDLSTAASMFYVTYVVFQLPGNLSLKLLNPQIQLALAMMVWGLFNTLMCTVKSYAGVVGLRLGVGFGEAFFQAAPLYVSLWYKRDEYSKRAAIIFSASSFAGILNGLLAYAVEKDLNGKDGLASWRWLFLIEGSSSIAWGLVVLLLLPPSPEKVRIFFSAAEKDLAIQRTREAFNEPHSSIRWQDFAKIFRGWNIYLFAIVFSCGSISLASFSTFLPVILRTLGYSRLDSQLLTIPVYAVSAISTVTMAYFSDLLERRGYFLMTSFALLTVGWLLLLVSTSSRLSFAATFFVGAGAYPSVVLAFSWVLNNQAGFTRRAGTYAIIGMVGQSFAIAATEIYSDPPRYFGGNGFALGSAVVGFCTCLLLVNQLQRANRRKKAAASSHMTRSSHLMSFEELGNEHPDFYYYI